MKKLRVLVLVHESLVPPETMEGYSEKEIMEWKTEFDVVHTLRDMGHEARPLGLSDDLSAVRAEILEWRPHVAFNLLEEFHNVATYDQHVVSYLELMRQPYTGCNPRGLLLSHDKALSKKLLTYHRIPTPRFAVFPLGRAVRTQRRLAYPLFVKSVTEDASLGISQASIVYDEEHLKERTAFVHEQTRSDALVEEFIEGREFYVGIIGNRRLQALPVWELLFRNLPRGVAGIATRTVKWDRRYQEEHGVVTQAARDLPAGMAEKIQKLCKRVYRVLELSGYARMDLRVREDGQIFFLEANANPNLSYGEDFAESANSVGIRYEDLLTRIMSLGMSYRAAWKG